MVGWEGLIVHGACHCLLDVLHFYGAVSLILSMHFHPWACSTNVLLDQANVGSHFICMRTLE